MTTVPASPASKVNIEIIINSNYNNNKLYYKKESPIIGNIHENKIHIKNSLTLHTVFTALG